MAILSSLNVFLGLNSTVFRRELKKSADKFQHFTKFVLVKTVQVTKGLGKITVAALKMALKLKRATSVGMGALRQMAIATTVSASVVGYAVNRTLDSLDELRRHSANVGVATEQWQAYTFAAKKAGLESEDLVDTFKDLNAKIVDAADAKSGPMVDFFKRINQQARDWKSLSPDEQFKRFVHEINKLPETEARFWLDELNDSSAKLFDTLVANKGEFFANAQKARELGIVMSDDVMQQVKRTRLEVSTLMATLSALWDNTVAAASPAIEAISKGIRGWVTDQVKAQGGFFELGRTIALSVINGVRVATQTIADLYNFAEKGILKMQSYAGTGIFAGMNAKDKEYFFTAKERYKQQVTHYENLAKYIDDNFAKQAAISLSFSKTYAKMDDGEKAYFRKAKKRYATLQRKIKATTGGMHLLTEGTARYDKVMEQLGGRQKELAGIEEYFKRIGYSADGMKAYNKALIELANTSQNIEELREFIDGIGYNADGFLSTILSGLDAAEAKVKAFGDTSENTGDKVGKSVAKSAFTLNAVFSEQLQKMDGGYRDTLSRIKTMIGEFQHWHKMSETQKGDAIVATGAFVAEQFASQSKTAAKLQKGYLIYQATMSTYDAAVKSYDALAGVPYVGPALGAAAAAAAIAFGIARVNQIRSTQPAGARQYGGNVAANSLYEVNEWGAPEVLEQDGKQYLMTGRKGGRVIANDDYFSRVLSKGPQAHQVVSSISGQVKQLFGRFSAAKLAGQDNRLYRPDTITAGVPAETKGTAEPVAKPQPIQNINLNLSVYSRRPDDIVDELERAKPKVVRMLQKAITQPY